MFGGTSAPEKYQQIVRGVLRGCEGVANIIHALSIHGNGVEEHDKSFCDSGQDQRGGVDA